MFQKVGAQTIFFFGLSWRLQFSLMIFFCLFSYREESSANRTFSTALFQLRKLVSQISFKIFFLQSVWPRDNRSVQNAFDIYRCLVL